MKKIETIILTLFLFLLSFIPFLWFPKDQILIGYDNVYPLNGAAFLKDRIFSWTTTSGFDMDQSGIQGSLVIHFIDAIPQLLGLPIQLGQKIVFSFWFFLLLFSPYFFITRLEKIGLIKSPYLRYFFPILYAFNFYILQAWWVAERTKFSLVVVMPLILSILLPMALRKFSLKSTIKSAFIVSLLLFIFNGGGWVGFPLYGGLLVVLLVYYLFFLGFYFFTNHKKNMVYLTLFFLCFGFSYILLNAYTFVPFFLTTLREYSALVQNSGGVSGLIEWAKYLSDSTSIANLLRLQGIPDWYNGGKNHPYALIYLNNPFLIFFSFLFPAFLFLSFLKRKKEHTLLIFFFLMLLIVSLLFTQGLHKPLGVIMEFFMRVIPGFIAFRSSVFKFGYAYWFAASFFIGLFLSEIIEFALKNIKGKQVVNPSKIILPLVVVILLVLYHFPYLTGNIFHIESNKIASRVTVPSYVYEFSKWWAQNGKNDKVLLLPQLNSNWGLEQYRWGYMSLAPILGNFANKNIVENTIVLSSTETKILNDFYSAINEKNYPKMDANATILSIKYFLVRKDFYDTIPDQETTNPLLLEAKLLGNPKIVKVKSFGQWDLYVYAEEKPLFFAKISAVLGIGNTINEYYTLMGNPLILQENSFTQNPQAFSHIFIQPECLNCDIEKEDFQLLVPKPRILIDSKFYQFVELRDQIFKPKRESVDNYTTSLLGETLRLSGQINELITQGRDEEYITIAKNKFIRNIELVSQELPNIFEKSPNPYYTFFVIQQYLEAEDKYIANIISTKIDKKSTFSSLEKILLSINQLNNKVQSSYAIGNASIEKKYRFVTAESGNYFVRIRRDTTGTLVNNNPANIAVSINNKLVTVDPKLDNTYIILGNLYFEKGDQVLTLTFPEQKNLLSHGTFQVIAARNCFSSTFDNFSAAKTYSLRFFSRNNFDQSFYLFIDNAETYSPTYRSFFPISREQVTTNKIVVSSSTMHLDKYSHKLRIAFCAATLTEDLFKENISDLSLIELTSPVVTLVKQEKNVSLNIPEITFEEINQTHYKAHVKKAIEPFYLVFSRKYSSGWRASIGDHTIGNKYANVWHIDQTGDMDIDITYNPQKYFIFGAVISILSLMVVIATLIILKKHEA